MLKWVLLQSVKIEISVHDQLFCRHQHWGSLHCVTRKLDPVQRQQRISVLKDKCDKTHFSVRPRDVLHPSPVNSALCVVIMFVLVCLCRFLWQVILLTYMSYELVAWCILRSISGWFPNFKSLFSNSVLPLNLNNFSEYCINSTHSLMKCMLTGCSVFVVYTTLDPDVKCPDGHFASRWHTTQCCWSIEISVYTRTYRHLRTCHI